MRDWSPEPALIRKMVCASMALMPRKSRVSAPGTWAACHVTPPSVVTSQVPPLPLANAVRASTALTPRNDARVLLTWGAQACARRLVVKHRAGTSFMVSPWYSKASELRSDAQGGAFLENRRSPGDRSLTVAARMRVRFGQSEPRRGALWAGRGVLNGPGIFIVRLRRRWRHEQLMPLMP